MDRFPNEQIRLPGGIRNDTIRPSIRDDDLPTRITIDGRRPSDPLIPVGGTIPIPPSDRIINLLDDLPRTGSLRPGSTTNPVGLTPADPDVPWIEIKRIHPGLVLPPRTIGFDPKKIPVHREPNWSAILGGRLTPPIVVSPTPAKIPIDSVLVLKAYATALRPFLTLEHDLSQAQQAIFIANPLQLAIPSGMENDEYLNEAIIEMANPSQNPVSPAYSKGGTSYFDWLQR
jgi:hypothetical protein